MTNTAVIISTFQICLHVLKNLCLCMCIYILKQDIFKRCSPVNRFISWYILTAVIWQNLKSQLEIACGH